MTQLLSDTTGIDLTRALAVDENVRPGVLERSREERLARRRNRYRDLGLP